MKRFWKKYHKWVGLVFSFFILVFCFSGIILNHRKEFSRCELSRGWMPRDYRFDNWNNGMVKGTLRLPDSTIFFYGNTGVWKTDSCFTDFAPVNEGFDKGVDNRKISHITTLPDRSIWCAALYDIYRLDGEVWTRQPLPGNKERVTDVTFHGDTLVALTRSQVYTAVSPYQEFKGSALQAPEGYTGKQSLFRQIWLLHSGELFGMVGKIIVDCLSVILIILCITGILYTFLPKIIKKRKKKSKDTTAAIQTMKTSTKWHFKLGTWLFVPTLILAVTGWCLRPPMMIPFVMSSSKPLPGSTLDSDNPWHDKLRAVRWDDACGKWLMSTSEGFFWMEDFKDVPVKASNVPPISPMGINVFHQERPGEWIIGSFSGMYRWNTATDLVTDYFNGETYDPSKASFFGSSSVAGYSADLAPWKEVVFDYGSGAHSATNGGLDFAEMPELLRAQPMSLWNFALEMHVGRCYYPILGPLSSMFVFIAGLLLTFTLISGYVLRPGRKKKKKK